MKKKIDITAVIMAHNEKMLLAQSNLSFDLAVKYAENNNLTIETFLVLDNPDTFTRELASSILLKNQHLYEFEYGDQGLVKNDIINLAQGEYIAFLDGDDFWSENWLWEAYKKNKKNKNAIVHPEFNWFFGGSQGVLKMVSDEDTLFDPHVLKSFNIWDALCFAPRRIYQDIPYCIRDVKGGFAYEDWFWNCESILKGYRHLVAENTVIVKRRREDSQTMKASAAKVLIRETKFLEY